MKTNLKGYGIIAFIAMIGIAFFASISLAGCDNGNDPGSGNGNNPGSGKPTPVAADYDIGNLEQTAGSVTAVTITAKNGKSSGAITIKYNGSTTIPQTFGTYAVTFDVAAAAGWNAASGLSAGVLTVDPRGENKESAITLTLNQWKNGNIAAKGEQWFKFTATASPQYIHFDRGTLEQVYVQVYDSTGEAIGAQTNLYSSKLSMNITVTPGSVYYIKVTPYSNSGSGAYKITFNASFTPPDVTQLTANTWTNGNIATAGGEQWFKFTATASPQYIHFDPGTSLNDVWVQVYDSTGAAIGSRTNLYGNTLYTSRTVTPDSVYYIKVTPSYSNRSGAYGILFNAIPLPTTGDVTQLTLNTWADGNIAIAGGEQLFKFTATAATYIYIHFQTGTLNHVDVQVYDSTGAAIESRASLFYATLSMYRTVTPDSVYYIKVTPYRSTDSGEYKIAFNTSSAEPFPPKSATLTLNTWKGGYLGGEEWFKFTATAATHYIHFQKGSTLDDVYVQVYDSTGAPIGDRKNLRDSGYSPDSYMNLAVTVNSEYYIKVTARFSGTPSGSGAYKIGFNTSTTKPSN